MQVLQILRFYHFFKAFIALGTPLAMILADKSKEEVSNHPKNPSVVYSARGNLDLLAKVTAICG